MWSHKNIVSIRDFSAEDIEFVLNCASRIDGKRLNICRGQSLATVFFEPSTRTEKSFHAAMYNLGGNVLSLNEETSSRKKGESKEDTMRMVGNYCDILVVRDDEPGSFKRYTGMVDVPFVNAGDGHNEHPTQALLDMYTIWKTLGRLSDLKIVFVGNPMHYRPMHSLCLALSKFPDNEIVGISPPGLEMPGEYRYSGYSDMAINMSILGEKLAEIKPDVVYAGRIPKEYMEGDPKKYAYQINRRTMENLHTLLMHPLPRVDEISTDLDSDKRFLAFGQAKNGVPVRMALIALCLGHDKEI